jgi:hypothetical protein
MNCEEIKIHLIDLIDGNLPEPLRKEVEEGLANCPECQQEYEELKMLFQTFQNQPIMPAPKALDDVFYAFLEQEKLAASTPQVKAMQVVSEDTDNGKETNTPLLWGRAWGGAIKIAASLILLIVAFFMGRQSIVNQSNEEIAVLKQEIIETKNLVMLNMLKQESASERIKAVGYAYDMEDADKEMIDALVNVMNYDKSVNVRLEAINALYYFGDKKEVRQAMTQSLRLQTEPNLQIALIEMLVRLKEKGAVNEMQRMMKNKQLPEIVKFKAAEGVGELYKL